jgi:hypothetical protein
LGEVSDPLLRLLVTKGVLSLPEARSIGSGGPDASARLVEILKGKGILSDSDMQTLHPVTQTVLATAPQATPPASKPTEAPKPAGPAVIPAVAPVRVLAVDPPKREGLVPDIKIGPVRAKPYGYFKMSVVRDSSSPGGNDFPLPGFLGDTGPDGSPEFHIKARNTRVGTNFEWVDLSPKMTLTGRLEFDFEGNFTRVNNRNISSMRSNQPSLRLAWGRLDYATSDKTSVFALFGQDWTPFGSSTLPNLVEGTGVGIAFGSLYERAPQARFGLVHNFGGSRTIKFLPEIAVVLPVEGNLPSDLGNQLGFGERQGVDADRPEIEGRVVLQWQLDKAKGVPPAQLIGSFMQGKRAVIVPGANVPAAFKAAFPFGAKTENDRYGWSGEIQLPTRYLTVTGKYYSGEDLRFFFAGQLFSVFNETLGLTGVATAPSIDGSNTAVFGLRNGVAVIAPQRPIRSQGGFVQLGFPLSRIFNANPAGRNAGWTLYLDYGYDSAFARDVRKLAAANRNKSDMIVGSLQYKLNQWVTFAYEQSYYRTRAITGPTGLFPLYRGRPSREWFDQRSEFATIFTF